MMQSFLHLSIHIEPSRQGTYLTLPFQVPDGIESITLKVGYDRRPETEQVLDHGLFTARTEVNVIDLGLIDPLGVEVGASGSDKTEIVVSEREATPGYRPCRIVPGKWQILIGAYKVAPEGVTVQYEVRLHRKSRRLLRGDLHVHTLGSDGVHTPEELAWKAKRNGLAFVAITDHNQFVSREALPSLEGVTLIPGVEWTHYQGHASFLGVDRPYDGTFATNSVEEATARFVTARQRGALIIIDHPFDPVCGFQFDISLLPHDCIEVWNGPMRESNLRAIGFWHQLLCDGRKIPACGGSDYHRDTPFIFLGGPTMCVFAESAGASDILAAVKAGHGFITFAPDGPAVKLTAGGAIMGDSVNWQEQKEVRIGAQGLLTGDMLCAVTAEKSETLLTAPSDGDVSLTYAMEAPGFVRAEIWRSFLPGVPMLPALISNPIFFDGA
ncbi:MAG: CehA/McbA family metallohydrolase [Anaerolineae bacterium]|nr:CehA/McbA family metallohydrolase [Anaerolineae bacterium]